MTEPIRCTHCSSTRLWITKRSFSDVVATWAQYAMNFLFSSVGKDGFPGASSSAEQRFDFEAHRGLATARLFWRCRDCGATGAIFDDDVSSPEPLADEDKTGIHTAGGWWPWLRGPPPP